MENRVQSFSSREEAKEFVLKEKSKSYLLELATSMGKTALALHKMDQVCRRLKEPKILVVCPYKTIINNWKTEEITKWGYENYLDYITFGTYKSLGMGKYVDIKWDFIICDEVHHLSELCQESFNLMETKYFMGLSATVGINVLRYLNNRFNNSLCRVSVNLSQAINSKILAEPEIYLLPLQLDNTKYDFILEKKGKSKGKPITIKYPDKWKMKGYSGNVNIICTQRQYYNDLSGLIEWYKQKSMRNSRNTSLKNMWLFNANKRLKWLAEQKTEAIKRFIKIIGSTNNRGLIFCADIKQSEQLGIECVNSKIGIDNIDRFNKKEINMLASVAILDEGVSLNDCRFCMFQMINASQRMLWQRTGRSMRHDKPIIIYPYYADTREEEIIKKEVYEVYDNKLIHTINSITDIKL